MRGQDSACKKAENYIYKTESDGMVLPLIIFEFLVLTAIALFIFGMTRQTLNAGFIFIALSSIIFIVSGAMLWSGGLQLNTVSEYTNNPDGSTGVVYNTATTNNGEPLWVISNVFVYGGIGLLLISLMATVKQRRTFRQEAYEETY